MAALIRFFSTILSSDVSTTEYPFLRTDEALFSCCSMHQIAMFCTIIILTIALLRFDIKEWPRILSKRRPEKQPKVSLVVASCVEEVAPPIGTTIVKAKIVVST